MRFSKPLRLHSKVMCTMQTTDYNALWAFLKYYNLKKGKRRMENIQQIENLPIMVGVKQTAKNFGIAEHHARQLALTGKVKATRAGNKILINQQSVADYFNSCTLAVAQETEIKPIPYRI